VKQLLVGLIVIGCFWGSVSFVQADLPICNGYLKLRNLHFMSDRFGALLKCPGDKKEFQITPRSRLIVKTINRGRNVKFNVSLIPQMKKAMEILGHPPVARRDAIMVLEVCKDPEFCSDFIDFSELPTTIVMGRKVYISIPFTDQNPNSFENRRGFSTEFCNYWFSSHLQDDDIPLAEKEIRCNTIGLTIASAWSGHSHEVYKKNYYRFLHFIQNYLDYREKNPLPIEEERYTETLRPGLGGPIWSK